MKRGKLKRLLKLKKKRVAKRKRGRNVPFSLANSGKKYPGFHDKYFLDANIHNLIYKDAKFENVKFQSSNITDCNFKNAALNGVDFCHTNLKKSNFENAYIKNSVFFMCNLKGTNFKNAKFENTYFISTNICNAKYLFEDEILLVNKLEKREYCDCLVKILYDMRDIKHFTKYKVLLGDKCKPNRWYLNILISKYGDSLNRALYALLSRKNKSRFFTLYSYMRHIEKYLKL